MKHQKKKNYCVYLIANNYLKMCQDEKMDTPIVRKTNHRYISTWDFNKRYVNVQVN